MERPAHPAGRSRFRAAAETLGARAPYTLAARGALRSAGRGA